MGQNTSATKLGQNTSATKFNLFTLAFQKLTAVNTETKKGGRSLF